MFCEVAPVFHSILYPGVPPETVSEIAPLFPPKQSTFIEGLAVAASAAAG